MSEPPGSIVLFRRVPAGVRPASLERYARALRDDVAGGRAFDCLITNDRELRRLNREFRGKDTATDVLSFPSGAAPQVRGWRSRRPRGSQQPAATGGTSGSRADRGGRPTIGSLAVSWQRAAAQAREHRHSLDAELRILMLHGVLHLLGMDHETDRGRMARAESRWRAQLALPNGLIERAAR